jgi:hypothetical protein
LLALLNGIGVGGAIHMGLLVVSERLKKMIGITTILQASTNDKNRGWAAPIQSAGCRPI